MERNRCLWVVMVFLVVEKVFTQRNVTGVTGGDVVLPCIYPDTVIKDVNIYWEDEEGRRVYDVLRGKADLDNQHPAYSGRTNDYQSGYDKGNVSLLLRGLKANDSGTYTCSISNSVVSQKVNLMVKNGETVLSTSPAGPKNRITPAGGSVSVREHCLSPWLLPLLHILLLHSA